MTITGADGAPLAGWYEGATGDRALPDDVAAVVAQRAREAEAGAQPSSGGFVDGLRSSWTTLGSILGLAEPVTVLAAAPIRNAGQSVGAVVVGVSGDGQRGPVGSALLTILLVGLIPVLIAVMVALALTRTLTGAVEYLLEAADRISRGDLEHAVELRRHDELGQLARAIERMRVSLQEGLERLRRRR